MRILIVTLTLLLLSSNFCWAIVPANDETINEAQNYGKVHSMIPFIKFISQWTSYEENAPRIDSKTEYAYIYTPFLLVATDAREKFLAGQEVSVVDGKKLLTPYQDYLVFGITLLGNTQHFDKISKCFLNTGNVLINSYQVLTGEAIKTPWFPEQPYYMAKYYVYFPNKEITLNRPVTVTLVTVDKHEHRFYFNLDNVK